MSTIVVTRFSPVEHRQLLRGVKGLVRSADFFFYRHDWMVELSKRTQDKVARKRVAYRSSNKVVPEGTYLLANMWFELHVMPSTYRDPLPEEQSPIWRADYRERVSLVVPTSLIREAFPDPSYTQVDPDSLGTLVRVEWTRPRVVAFVMQVTKESNFVAAGVQVFEKVERRVPLFATSDKEIAEAPNGERFFYDEPLHSWLTQEQYGEHY